MTTLQREQGGRRAGPVAPRVQSEQQLAIGKRRRQFREAMTGYLFVLPATVATILFGLWPVVAGFYESVKSGSPITNKYVGLDNYLRQLGSLTYAILLGVSLVLVLLAYYSWRGVYARFEGRRHVPWMYLVPGFLGGMALIVVAFLLVTGVDGLMWFPTLLILLAMGGFFAVDQLQRHPAERDWRQVQGAWLSLAAIGAAWFGGPAAIEGIGAGTLGWIVLVVLVGWLLLRLGPPLGRIRTAGTIGAITGMCTFLIAAVLLIVYAINHMDQSTREARQLAAELFNSRVMNATTPVVYTDARVAGLAFEQGQVVVEVKVGSQTIFAPLAPEAYSELPVEKIARLEAAFVNNQKVQVVLPDGTITEGQLTGLAQGEQLDVGFVTNGARTVRMEGIYTALDVGEAVVQNNGHTEPVLKQFYAALGLFVGVAAIYTMTWVRRRLDDELAPRLYRLLHYGRVLMAIVLFALFFYLVGAVQLSQQAAAGMGALTQNQFDRAYTLVRGQLPPATLRPDVLEARLLYWPQVFSIAVGAFLIGMAYLVWQSAQKRETRLGFAGTIVLAVAMMVGGWLLIGEVPRALDLGGRETEEALNALNRTAMYSIGTVPVQLALGLFLAYLLFSEISWGKSLYRVIYFMPYIAPSVATSTVFLVIFRLEPTSLANRAARLLGFDPLTWLKEPQGIIRIFYAQILGGNPLNIPESLAGPSLALTTVILYNIWVFAGYNAVVFLAGLGAIPTELYEAAQVDGAGRWSRFRNITLPLLSPTTFFLSMLSIIGTFKAFSHIYVLREQASGKEIDTMSVHIFNTLYAANDPGYAAALAFTLFGVILILTMVQNRLSREQVFYG